MAKKNVIPGGYAFGYRGRTSGTTLDLHKWVISVSDSLMNRIARHTYVKRDGAEKEPLGAGDGAFRFRLTIVGDDCTARYRELAQYIRANPRGTLTHPLLSDIKVACDGIEEGSIDIVNGVNCINVALKFSEDAVDSAITIADAPAPATAANQVTTSASTLTSTVPSTSTSYSSAATTSTNATTFAAAALSSYSTGTPDPKLSSQLDKVISGAAATEAALRADASYRNEAARYPAIVAVRNVVASALALDEALKRSRPAIGTFTVKQTMPLSSIAAVLYGGKQAPARMEELRRLNLDIIPNPFAVAAGTVLQVSQPTQ